MVHIRVLISLMCDPKYDVGSYDLTGAFSSTDFKGRAVYCQFPSDSGEDANKIVRLVKEVYGLKSSGISFIKQLRETILSFEYRGRRFQKRISNWVSDSSNIFVRVGRLRTRISLIGFLVLTSDTVMTKRNGQLQSQQTLIVLSKDSN